MNSSVERRLSASGRLTQRHSLFIVIVVDKVRVRPTDSSIAEVVSIRRLFRVRQDVLHFILCGR